jgi:hypothetical protein
MPAAPSASAAPSDKNDSFFISIILIIPGETPSRFLNPR